MSLATLETGTVTRNVIRIGVHTRSAYVTFVAAPVLCPSRHVEDPGDKVFSLNRLNDILATVTDYFYRLGPRPARIIGDIKGFLLQLNYSQNTFCMLAILQ